MTPPACRACTGTNIDGPHGSRPVYFCNGCGKTIDGNGTPIVRLDVGPTSWTLTKVLAKPHQHLRRVK